MKHGGEEEHFSATSHNQLGPATSPVLYDNDQRRIYGQAIV